MAVPVMNGSTIFRCCTVSPPLAALRCCLHSTTHRQHRSVQCHSSTRFSFSRRIQCRLISSGYGRVAIRRRYSTQSLVDMVAEELDSLRKRGIVRASNKLELKSSEELLENKFGKQVLQKGLLLEFRKDPERVLLAVVQKQDGKKNWIVSDQNGVMTSVKPQQVTYIVPGIKNFDHTDITNFVQKAQDNLDPALLEFAWIELLEKNKSTTAEELAEMIFGSAEPLESYTAHLLLAKDEIFFTVMATKGSYSIYGPRPAVQVDRTDLTHLKIYTIDVDEADELDDALSATRLQDGRIKIWIHVADPTRLVQPGSMIDKEAMKRGTSVFLPTATYPMFPERLAMEGMSLKQGERCKSVSVSAVLHSDGCIAEHSVENSVIKPTYMLTYESTIELLHLNLEEEAELRLLSEAAALRFQWRRGQGAIDTSTIETRIKVTNPDDPESSIKLYVENQADPAMRLVSEMMILCNEVIATFGCFNNLPLPYRGQPQSNVDIFAFAHLPEGPVRSSAVVKTMRAAEMDFRKPVRHGGLGLPGYVQFTSPIRRYMDLLAHYQGSKLRRRLVVRCDSREDPTPSGSDDSEVNSLGVIAALSILKFYKREISPLLPKSCRYVPTCSEYSMIAYKKYGFAKGTILTAYRLCRCNPLGGSGFDPPRWFDEPTPPEP